MVAQPAVTEEFDNLVFYGRTLRDSLAQTDPCAAKLIAQECPSTQILGVAIVQTPYATDASGKIQPCASCWLPQFQESCHPFDQHTRGLEDMSNAPLQRGC